MYALADVNSFYAGCEKLFRPDLRHSPVVVLSNNDGCVIARSPEAKALGVKMGIPWFQLQQQDSARQIVAFSSNYALYHSLSERVMTCLEAMAPHAEQYSIDEMFLAIGGIDSCTDFESFGRQLRRSVMRYTGLTVGVGMGPTRTLAKSAQWASKRWAQLNGVLALTKHNRARTKKLLSLQPAEAVWGVGHKTAEKLRALGISTALQLAQANPVFIRRHFSVVAERIVRELCGESCIMLAEAPPAKQQIVCSRSFGQRITTYQQMRQAVCQYAERAAEKLRGERQYCCQVCTFIKTSPYTPGETYYSNTASENLSLPARDSREVIAAAVRALDRIWLDGHRYAKAGVMLNDFTPEGVAQLNLFSTTSPRQNSDALMKVLDSINHSGAGRLWFAGQGNAPQWQMKRQMLSPAWTTRWQDIPSARLS